MTTAESDTYLRAVDAASPRVASGTLATSVQGRPLRYAVVGRPANVSPAGLARVSAAAAALRDPRTPPALAAGLAAHDAGDPLGRRQRARQRGERHRRRAAGPLRARRPRPTAPPTRILDNAVVVLLPTQNPDGREADTRRNAYGFDLNRDWFARTQPETDGKLRAAAAATRRCCSSTRTRWAASDYFFPPNADPIYHEITDESVSWINDLYGGALHRTSSTASGIPYFNGDVYDLFYMGYGDTVPATGFIAAGMTFEKDERRPDAAPGVTSSTSPSGCRCPRPPPASRTMLDGVARGVRRGDRRAGPAPGAQRDRQPGQQLVSPGAGPAGAALLPARRRPGQGGRGAARWCAGCSGWTCRSSGWTAPLRVPDYRPYGRAAGARRAAGGDLLDPDGAGPEALGAGDAQRGHVHAVPVLLRRHRVEQPAAVQRVGRLLRRGAAPPRGARPPGPAAGRAPAAGRRAAIALFQLDPAPRRSSPSGWLRWLLEQEWHAAVQGGDRPRRSPPADCPVWTSCWRPDGRPAEAASSDSGQAGSAALARLGRRRRPVRRVEAAAPSSLRCSASAHAVLHRADLRRARAACSG